MSLACPDADSFLRNVVNAVVVAICNTLPSVSTSDPMNRTHMTGESRKRQIDESYKCWATEELVRSGKDRTATDETRIDSGMNSTNCLRWVDHKIANHLNQVWSIYDCGDEKHFTGVFSTCEGGARIGNPAEEHVTYPFWDHSRQQGFWLPNMVPSC